jgi:tetratricopeptide (TPR) repeat protein
LNDIAAAEEMTKQLIISTVERSSPKGIAPKLMSVGEVLRSGQNKAHLEILQNFCVISANGISEKTDYKRLVEMTIYFNDFKFQVLLLDLFKKLGLTSEVENYATVVRENTDYNFVYLDKFFPHLKSLFVQPVKPKEKSKEILPEPDLKLYEKYKPTITLSEDENENSDDEQQFFHLLKYQTYSTSELCDLAVSFLQSEMPRVALRASEMGIQSSANNQEFLKASYLKLTCQLKLKDYRAAVDTCFVALEKAATRDDILSFMYGQAEAYIRLNQRRQAKAVLSKIVSIDAKYRLAKERLDQLNEI